MHLITRVYGTCIAGNFKGRKPSQFYSHQQKFCLAGNFRGRKLSRISRFFTHPRKFSPRNSRHATPIMRPVLTFHESFLREMLLSYRSAKVFSLENFPLYGRPHPLIYIMISLMFCKSFLWIRNICESLPPPPFESSHYYIIGVSDYTF